MAKLFSISFIRFLAIAFVSFALLWSARSLYYIITTSAPDFSILWTSTRELINFRNPYTVPNLFTVNAYPPITFLAYIPLAVLPYSLAQGIFTILSFLSVFWTVYISLKILSKKSKIKIYEYLMLLSLALISFPTKFTLGMGQINLIALSILITSYYFYKNKKDKYSGLLLGLVFLLKPIMAFILLFFLIKKKWKIIFYSAVVPTISLLLIILAFGSNPVIYWIKDILPQLTVIAGREVYYNQGILGFISRITNDIGLRTLLSNLASIVLVVGVVTFSLSKSSNENISFSLFLTTLLLVDNLSWQHHFVWLIFPYIVLFKNLKKMNKVWLWLILLLSYFLVSWNIKNPQVFNTFPKTLLQSNTFFGTLLLLLIQLKISKQK